MTKPEVFIIESLNFDEEADYREGEMIYRSLRMSRKFPIYRYIRTIGELEHFIDEFGESNYRYLHISCHGNNTRLAMTLEDITTESFAKIVGPTLDKRRLFLSTCEAATLGLANGVFANGGCYSVAGPTGEINFDDSVILWTSFYHLMFKADAKKMRQDAIKQTLSKCGSLVDEEISLFVRPKKNGKARLTKLPVRALKNDD
jgi:hypothetical protein